LDDSNERGCRETYIPDLWRITMEEVLRIENVSKSFPGVKAVDNVSFSLMKGEVLVLIGENGAGKSTLSQILGGVYKPDEGQVLLGVL
jgi:ribose transport system ATP-binding protein